MISVQRDANAIESRDAFADADERWRRLLRTGANVLIVGPRCALDTFLTRAYRDLAQPLYVVPPSAEIPHDHPGTLVLMDVARLTEAQQAGLVAWLDESTARTQVISLSEHQVWHPATPALRLDLYYRLNTIYFEAPPGDGH
jgi:hypothetical protein